MLLNSASAAMQFIWNFAQCTNHLSRFMIIWSTTNNTEQDLENRDLYICPFLWKQMSCRRRLLLSYKVSLAFNTIISQNDGNFFSLLSCKRGDTGHLLNGCLPCFDQRSAVSRITSSPDGLHVAVQCERSVGLTPLPLRLPLLLTSC